MNAKGIRATIASSIANNFPELEISFIYVHMWIDQNFNKLSNRKNRVAFPSTPN
jgi:hypothetical protein